MRYSLPRLVFLVKDTGFFFSRGDFLKFVLKKNLFLHRVEAAFY